MARSVGATPVIERSVTEVSSFLCGNLILAPQKCDRDKASDERDILIVDERDIYKGKYFRYKKKSNLRERVYKRHRILIWS